MRIEADVQNREHFEQARELAEEALATVHRFQARIVDSKIRRGIQERAGELEKLLSSLGWPPLGNSQ
jgi:hypothetical protein